MGKMDEAAKEYLSNPDRFADLFNHEAYGDEQVVDPKLLRPVDSVSTSAASERRRDLLRSWMHMEGEDAAYALLAIEDQAVGHPAMPARCAIYDAMAYGEQIREIARANKRDGMPEANTAEFLSGLWEQDRLRPVVTLVLYLSPDDWTWAESLHDVIGYADERLMALVPDYRMNLVAPARKSDKELDAFSTEVGLALKYIKHSKDKEDLDRIVREDSRYRSVGAETAEFISIMTGSNLAFEEEEGKIDMCKAIDDMRAEERLEGRIEGERKGRLEGRLESLRGLMASTGWGLARALDALGVPQDERDTLVAELGAAT